MQYPTFKTSTHFTKMYTPTFSSVSYALCLVLPGDGLSKTKHVEKCITNILQCIFFNCRCI